MEGKLLYSKSADLNVNIIFKKNTFGTSLMAQWLRIHLPMQGTQVRSLVWGRSHMLQSN